MEAAVAAARERAARLAQAHTSTTKDSGADRSQRDRDDGGDRSATGERERERESLRETERGPSSAVVPGHGVYSGAGHERKDNSQGEVAVPGGRTAEWAAKASFAGDAAGQRKAKFLRLMGAAKGAPKSSPTPSGSAPTLPATAVTAVTGVALTAAESSGEEAVEEIALRREYDAARAHRFQFGGRVGLGFASQLKACGACFSPGLLTRSPLLAALTKTQQPQGAPPPPPAAGRG